ncbi:MAG: hypothetical protein RLY93_00505 [Sumerlaeia bacterium]
MGFVAGGAGGGDTAMVGGSLMIAGGGIFLLGVLLYLAYRGSIVMNEMAKRRDRARVRAHRERRAESRDDLLAGS